MTQVKRTFTVTSPPNKVVDYLADFSHAEQWDPGTVRCVRDGSGPIKVGAKWKNTSKIAGVSSDLTYTLTELSPGGVVLVGENKTATSTERISVNAAGTGSEIVYVNDTVFNGAAKLAAPLVRLVFERLAAEVVKGLSEELNAL